MTEATCAGCVHFHKLSDIEFEGGCEGYCSLPQFRFDPPDPACSNEPACAAYSEDHDFAVVV